jgi:hypothetical protein
LWGNEGKPLFCLKICVIKLYRVRQWIGQFGSSVFS